MAPAVCWRNRGVGTSKDELGTARRLLREISVAGLIVTGDALYTNRSLCERIVASGGDYLFVVKENQPALYRELCGLFCDPERKTHTCQQSDIRGDRHEWRRLEATDEIRDYLQERRLWPHVGQVARVCRTVEQKGKPRTEEVYLVTSLSEEKASPERLLALHRGHWGIENRLHWVRDVTMGEDKCQVRTDQAPFVMAALRNATIGLLRLKGCANIAAALRRNAAHPIEALALVGCHTSQEN